MDRYKYYCLVIGKINNIMGHFHLFLWKKWPPILRYFVDVRGALFSIILLLIFIHLHSIFGNETNNGWIFITSTMVGKIFGIWLLWVPWKLLIKVTWCYPFLILPSPFRNLFPLSAPSFSTFSNFSTPLICLGCNFL